MGLLVALTGLDGSGKSTQGKRLYKKCLSEGLSACYIYLKEIDSKPYYNKAVIDTRNFIKKRSITKSDEIRNIIRANLFIAKVQSKVLPITEVLLKCNMSEATFYRRLREFRLLRKK